MIIRFTPKKVIRTNIVQDIEHMFQGHHPTAPTREKSISDERPGYRYLVLVLDALLRTLNSGLSIRHHTPTLIAFVIALHPKVT